MRNAHISYHPAQEPRSRPARESDRRKANEPPASNQRSDIRLPCPPPCPCWTLSPATVVLPTELHSPKRGRYERGCACSLRSGSSVGPLALSPHRRPGTAGWRAGGQGLRGGAARAWPPPARLNQAPPLPVAAAAGAGLAGNVHERLADGGDRRGRLLPDLPPPLPVGPRGGHDAVVGAGHAVSARRRGPRSAIRQRRRTRPGNGAGRLAPSRPQGRALCGWANLVRRPPRRRRPPDED